MQHNFANIRSQAGIRGSGLTLLLSETQRENRMGMMGIPIVGPSNVLCDNTSVVDNASLPESQLKKKHLSIAYHYVRECFAKLEHLALYYF